MAGLKFQGQIALITGGAHGIGKATARRVCADGASVVVADRDAASIEAMVKRTIDTFGVIDILHNNVGVTVAAWSEDKPVVETPVEVWDMIFDVNVRAHFLTSKFVLPHMIKRGKGSIVNTASIGGLAGSPSLVSCTVSKAAVVHLTKCLAVQYGRDGIRTNCIASGVIKTKQLLENSGGAESGALDTLPFPRTGDPEDIANLVSSLASGEASFINGEVVVCDGGSMAGQAPRLGTQRA